MKLEDYRLGDMMSPASSHLGFSPIGQAIFVGNMLTNAMGARHTEMNFLRTQVAPRIGKAIENMLGVLAARVDGSERFRHDTQMGVLIGTTVRFTIIFRGGAQHMLGMDITDFEVFNQREPQ